MYIRYTIRCIPLAKLAKHCQEGSRSVARWVFTCKNCFKVVPNGEVGNTLTDYFFPKKPEIPVEGIEMECPECKTKYVYQQNELWYERN